MNPLSTSKKNDDMNATTMDSGTRDIIISIVTMLGQNSVQFQRQRRRGKEEGGGDGA